MAVGCVKPTARRPSHRPHSAAAESRVNCTGLITEVGAEAWWLPGNTKSKRDQGAHGGSRILGFPFVLIVKSVCACLQLVHRRKGATVWVSQSV